MKKLITILLGAFLLIPAYNYAQHDGGHTFTNGDNSLEIGGYIVTYYQFRPKYPGDNNTSSTDNVFAIDDARISLRGWVHGRFKFHFEYNFAALGSWLGIDPTQASQTPPNNITKFSNGNAYPYQIALPTSSPKDNPLTECHVTYTVPVVGIDVKVGYMKVPYALNSLSDKLNLAFLERTKFDNSDYDPRRDAGIQLFKDFWHQRVGVYGAIMSGMGENIIYGIQDANGKPMYCGRIELSSNPYKWVEFDKVNKSIPVARVSGNFKYNDKTQFSGNGTTLFSTQNIRTIDGQKWTYGGDASLCWHGFSGIFEWTQSRMTSHNNPGNGLTGFLEGLGHGARYLLNGGYYVEGNYYNKYAMSGIALKFAQEDLTENIASPAYTDAQQRTLYMAYVFNLAKYNVQFRFHYAYRFKQPNIHQKWAEDECRIGIVYQF